MDDEQAIRADLIRGLRWIAADVDAVVRIYREQNLDPDPPAIGDEWTDGHVAAIGSGYVSGPVTSILDAIENAFAAMSDDDWSAAAFAEGEVWAAQRARARAALVELGGDWTEANLRIDIHGDRAPP